MRFRNLGDNKYLTKFMRATEALIKESTVSSFIEYLKNNGNLEEADDTALIDGSYVSCDIYLLRETPKLKKEFIVTKDGRVFYYVNITGSNPELVDESDETKSLDELYILESKLNFLSNNDWHVTPISVNNSENKDKFRVSNGNISYIVGIHNGEYYDFVELNDANNNYIRWYVIGTDMGGDGTIEDCVVKLLSDIHALRT